MCQPTVSKLVHTNSDNTCECCGCLTEEAGVLRKCRLRRPFNQIDDATCKSLRRSGDNTCLQGIRLLPDIVSSLASDHGETSLLKPH